MIYLDSAALVKLAHEETSTTELRTWLAEHDLPLVSSALVEVEVPRALRRIAPEAIPAVSGLLERIYRLDIDRAVRRLAGDFTDQQLRSPDAIHLATAQLLATESHGGLSSFVTYDRRLLAAAEAGGLKAESPGQAH